MKATTLPKFLIGSREAILDLAASRRTIVIALLFVLTAGFAREYDGEDLLREPWHVLRPVLASLISGSVLFFLVDTLANIRRKHARGKQPELKQTYWSFMGVFWMTAPMAWLYAVPYERFLSAPDAIGVNLWTLALVSAWRVVLIQRVVNVLYGINWCASIFFVMLFADAVVGAVLMIAPIPVIDVMGGLDQSESEEIVAGTAFMIGVLAVLSAPVWIIGSFWSAFYVRPTWAGFREREVDEKSRGLLVVAIVSVVAFVVLFVVTRMIYGAPGSPA